MSLFGEARRDEYLAFGTLASIVRLVSQMPDIQNSINTMHNSETVLHRVCKLNPDLEGHAHWDRIVPIHSSRSNESDHHRSLLRMVRAHRHTLCEPMSSFLSFSELQLFREPATSADIPSFAFLTPSKSMAETLLFEIRMGRNPSSSTP